MTQKYAPASATNTEGAVATMSKKDVIAMSGTCNTDNVEFPTPTMASTMPTTYREMDNTALTTLGATGNHAALEEMLKRHIMNTDKVHVRISG